MFDDLKSINSKMYVVFIVELKEAEATLKQIKDLGYAAFVRWTALGIEIVVTEKLYKV